MLLGWKGEELSYGAMSPGRQPLVMDVGTLFLANSQLLIIF